jgi:cutinase
VFALVGYSQGADLMHNVTITLDNKYPQFCSKVIAVVLFGDPGNRSNQPATSPLGGITYPIPPDYARKTKENCAVGDPVCSFTGTNVSAHLSYASSGTNFIPDSANYVYNQYTTHGNSGPQPASYGGPGGGQPTSPTPEEIAALLQLGELLGRPNTTHC